MIYILFSNLKDQYARFITFCIDNRDIIPASANDKVNKNLQFIRFGFSRVCNRLKINFDISATNNEMELVGAQIPGRLDLRLTSAKSVICMQDLGLEVVAGDNAEEISKSTLVTEIDSIWSFCQFKKCLHKSNNDDDDLMKMFASPEVF